MTSDRGLWEGMSERFWAKVQRGAPGECWLWQGAQNGHGYGSFRVSRPRRRLIYAHRFAYELEVAPIPDGLVIDHLCNTRACVNPAHMTVTTYAGNARRRSNSKLNEAQVRTIRAMSGTQAGIAERFGVSRHLIGEIQRGEKWA